MNDDAAPRIGARIQMTRLAPTFQPLAQFGSAESYKLLPFRFLNLNDGRLVLTNLAGHHLVSSRDTLEKLVARAPIDDTELRDLEGGHFISRGDVALHGELLAAQIRTKQSRLSDFTSLHMFVVALRCDHSCAYCQVSRVSDDKTAFDMSPETADKAVDLMLASPSPQLKVEFQGGESLLNFPIVERIVKRVKEKATDRETAFVVATNLSFLTDEMLSFFKEHGVSISTSLDGPEGLHNSNRPRPGKDSYQRTIDGIERCRRVLVHDAVSALMTCTVASLSAPEAIIDEYVAKGFREVFLRHISPYGFAVRAGSKVRYETERFLDFYRGGLAGR